MSSVPHTPGPWSAEIESHQAPSLDWYAAAIGVGDPYQGTHRTIARVRSAEHPYDDDEAKRAEAEARLIAAAPELLAALELALDLADDGLHGSGTCPEQPCWVELAEAAVAKAKGGAS